jgi:hypothetical protein
VAAGEEAKATVESVNQPEWNFKLEGLFPLDNKVIEPFIPGSEVTADLI